MSTVGRVLVVEDDPAIRELVVLHLRRGGFAAEQAADNRQAWPLLEQVDALVLDRMLPDESGDALLRRIRSNPRLAGLPVLLLTARATERERVEGLESGADDYLTKPFSAPELVARMRALLRRVPQGQRYQVGEIVVDALQARVIKGGEEVELTRREFELLAYLAAHPGRVHSRSELLDRVWGVEFVGTERTVDQHVAQLRSRLGESVIETVRGLGYRLAS